jgi:hypothetical protein
VDFAESKFLVERGQVDLIVSNLHREVVEEHSADELGHLLIHARGFQQGEREVDQVVIIGSVNEMCQNESFLLSLLLRVLLKTLLELQSLL